MKTIASTIEPLEARIAPAFAASLLTSAANDLLLVMVNNDFRVVDTA